MNRKSQKPNSLKRGLIYSAAACAFVLFIGLGVFANNGWLPHTDALTGKKTGWFGKELSKNARSTWNPLADVLPTPTPQLSKEYIYAGQRLLAVEDANANATPPADLAVWRPSSGIWYVLGGPGSQQLIQEWGIGPSVPVPGDYDGDGKTDLTLYAPGSTYAWYVKKSSDDSYYVVIWGESGDVAAVADYDGDGKTDIAVYRPNSPLFYIIRSSDSQFYLLEYGVSGDVPAPADYDGDGKADIAVWRDTNHSFYIHRSSDGQNQVATIGSAPTGVKPVPADYDGDGKADFAVFDPSVESGITDWYILQSSNGATVTYAWGSPSAVPVPNDYDGDGKCDIAVWGNTTGLWFIINSSGVYRTGVQWGAPGDIPVPAYYRR